MKWESEAMNAKESAVRKFLALFHATDFDLPQIREALAHNARWQPVVPLARPVEGVEAICAEAERQYRIYADCACEILNIATRGNTVFTERVDRVSLLAEDREVRSEENTSELQSLLRNSSAVFCLKKKQK